MVHGQLEETLMIGRSFNQLHKVVLPSLIGNSTLKTGTGSNDSENTCSYPGYRNGLASHVTAGYEFMRGSTVTYRNHYMAAPCSWVLVYQWNDNSDNSPRSLGKI